MPPPRPAGGGGVCGGRPPRAPPPRGELELQRLLLVDHREQPVLQGEAPARANAAGLGEHLLPAGAHRLGHVAAFEEAVVERRHELPRPAHVERPRHRHHAAAAGLQQRRRHRGEGVLRVRADHGAAAGVQDHHRHGVLAHQVAEDVGRHRVRPPLPILEVEAAGGDQQRVGAAGRGRLRTVVAVSVEVDDVVGARVFLQVLAEGVERGRAQDGHLRGQVPLGDHFHQRAGDGVVAHVVLLGAGDHQEDADAVAGQAGREGRRSGDLVQAALHAALLGQPAGAGVFQRLPRPGEHARVVALDAQTEAFGMPALGGLVQEEGAVARAEERLEGPPAPAVQRRQDALGVLHLRLERVVEELLQVPAQIPEQVRVGPAFHREAHGGDHRHRRPGLPAVGQAQQPEARRVGALNVADDQGIHEQDPFAALFDGRRASPPAPSSRGSQAYGCWCPAMGYCRAAGACRGR